MAALVFATAGVTAATAYGKDAGRSLGFTLDPARAKNETFAGAERLGSATSIYMGSVYAPFGTVHEDGARLRLSTSYGWYSYDGVKRIAGQLRPYTFHAQTSHTDAMLGYRTQLGRLTVKAYAGGAFDGQGLEAPEGLGGRAIGVKGAIETWLDLAGIGFAQLDASWTSAHDVYASRLRLGLRPLPALSLGPEVGVYGNTISDGGRLGGFLRAEWAGGEISVSGGMGGDRNGDSQHYATVNVLLRY